MNMVERDYHDAAARLYATSAVIMRHKNGHVPLPYNAWSEFTNAVNAFETQSNEYRLMMEKDDDA